MLIFKKIEKAIFETNKCMVMYKNDSDSYNLEAKKLKALREITDYVKTYNWLVRSDAISKVKAVLSSKYNYSLVAENFGVSTNSLQVTMSYASNILTKKIGDNTIDLILLGDVETAMVQFKIGVGDINLDEFLVKGVYELLPVAKYNVAGNLLDCGKEIDFLRNVTVKNLLRVKEDLNDDNLAFLKYILSTTDSRYSRERSIILKYILGEIESYDDFISLLSSVNLF